MSLRKTGKSLVFLVLRNLSITNWIIIANTAIYAFVSILLYSNLNFINYIALQPAAILQGKYLWTLISHMFMHASFFHLFFNMFSLFFIGSFVERVVGRKRFFWFYIASGLIAGIFFVGLAFIARNTILSRGFGDVSTIGVGASGAIFGLLGLLAVLTPRAKVYLIAGPLMAIMIQAILGQIFPGSLMAVFSLIINMYFILSLFAIFSFNPNLRKLALPIGMPFWFLPIIAILPLLVIGFFVSLPIGNTAHLGGLLTGLVYGFYLKRKYKKKIMILNRMLVK